MAPVTSVCFRNLPFHINEGELRQELLNIFKNAFGKANDEGTLVLKVYQQGEKKKIAVVSGFVSDFENMVLISRRYKIQGRDIVIKMDMGEERDQFGNFVTKLTPQQRRSRDQLGGRSHRKVLSVINSSFWEKINSAVYDGVQELQMYINSARFSEQILKKMGRLTVFHQNFFLNSSKIQYQTVLESIQAIRYLNNNGSYQPVILFTDLSGLIKSRCNEFKGIGVNGELLCVEETANCDIILFEQLDVAILDMEKIRTDLNSMCWRCEKRFNLTGIHCNLNYLVGVCDCRYNCDLDILDKSRAYFFTGEKFTRLIPATQGTSNLIISLPAMKKVYDSALEYADITLPIIQEEWKYNSFELKKTSSCTAIVIQVNFVEEIEKQKGCKSHIYGIQAVVPKTKFWSVENISGISKVTLTISGIRSFPNKETSVSLIRKGKVYRIGNYNSSKVTVFIRLEVEANFTPSKEVSALIVPKPIKTEYSATKHLIRKWSKDEASMSPLCKIFLNPRKTQNWKLSKRLQLKEGVWIPTHQKLKYLEESLNNEQTMAFSNAKNYQISVIHGPPGTGKTYTASAIANYLATVEKGHVLVIAPSNIAADGIAFDIQELGKQYSLPTQVLRIFSKKRETYLLQSGDRSFGDVLASGLKITYKLLHEEVASSPIMKSDAIRPIQIKIQNGNEYRLTLEERKLWDQSISKIESEIICNFQILVCTVGALSDKRVENWSREKPITSVLIDEVAQLTHPSTLASLLLKPESIIFAGDHLQLTPTVMSFLI